MSEEPIHVEKGKHSTHDQLTLTDEEEVESLTDDVDERGREAVNDYLEQNVDADTVMVKVFSTHTDFQTGRAVTIEYHALDDLRQMEIPGVHGE